MQTVNLKVSTIIPTKNRPVDLVQAVNSVFTQTHRPDQLLIIDQSLGDESRNQISDLYREFGTGIELIYVHDPSVAGLVAAKVVGTARSSGNIVMFLEDDVILDKDYIANLFQGFIDHPEMMGCCGVIKHVGRNSTFYLKLFHLFHRGIFRDVRVGLHGNPEKFKNSCLIPSNYLSGGLSAFRREVFSKIFFDTANQFFMLEDIDFSTRAARTFGCDKFFINPSACLDHKVSLINREILAPRFERKLREQIVFYKKNKDGRFVLPSLLWLLVGLFLEAAACSLSARSASPVSGTIRGILRGIQWELR